MRPSALLGETGTFAALTIDGWAAEEGVNREVEAMRKANR